MNIFELTFIVEKEDDAKEMAQILKDFSAKVIEENPWGKREFAYPINKLNSGFYYTQKIEVLSKSIADIKKKLNFNEKILRYLFLKLN